MGRSWYWLVCRVKVKERSRMMLGLSWIQDFGTLCCSGEHREEVSLRRSVWDILCLSVWVQVSQERRRTTGRRRKEIVSSLGLAQERGVVVGECQRNELALVEKMRTSVEKGPFHMSSPVLRDGEGASPIASPSLRASAVYRLGPSCSLLSQLSLGLSSDPTALLTIW